jgi:Ca2+-binding RTX toxin-like protein
VLKMSLSSLVFVDFRVEDYGTLVSGVAPGTGVVLLSPYRDGIEQITQVLRMSTSVGEIHILSHGSPGSLELGNSTLSLETLADYAPQLKTWSTSFSSSPHLLIYGCQVAAGDAGTEFVERLSALTSATVAASAKRTGSAALGGDWELEVTTGEVKVPVVFSEKVRSAYAGVLEITRVDTRPFGPSISADGRYVVFESSADNLVPEDTNGQYDVFVEDRVTGETTLVSVASDGTQGNQGSDNSSISADGRYVAFESDADNLVPEDTNNTKDVFVHDRVTGETTRISVATDGTQGNQYPYSDYRASISGDGRYVAFKSDADNLVPGDTNSAEDVFVHDRQTGETRRVSVATDGTQGYTNYYIESTGLSISGDGRYVAFQTVLNDLVPEDTNNDADIFVHDRQTGETTRLFENNGIETDDDIYLTGVSISADGRYVAFESLYDELVPEDTNHVADVFVHDRQTGKTRLISAANDGSPGNEPSIDPSISADGKYVAFYSSADNLVPGDTNNNRALFIASVAPPPNFIEGGSGNDDLVGGSSNEFIYGYAGDDTLKGRSGNDVLRGGADNDFLNGNRENDKLFGDTGNDTLFGDQGDDYLQGGEGRDQLTGSSGNDTLYGDRGDDTLRGGHGEDRFEFSNNANYLFYSDEMGIDRIRDFGRGVDRIILDKTTFNQITSAVGNGFSNPTEFASVTSGGDTSAADIVYNRTTGALYYNNNGTQPGWNYYSGSFGGQFAVLDGAPRLAASDFTLIA